MQHTAENSFPIKPRAWAAWLLARLGWHYHFAQAPGPKAVIVVYPHTSNWDFLWGILVLWASGWPLNWVGKHTLFIGPMGWLLRRWGGIPVKRGASEGFIDNIVRAMQARPYMLLVIAPEGTRRRTERWKSGFYRIARAAHVPLGLAYIDYGQRRAGIDAFMELSGDEAQDMDRIAQAYANRRAYDPSKAAPIRLGPPPDHSKPPGTSS
jgi:1-acyl-sn-glycerol-3-phosphate acyltransferase